MRSFQPYTACLNIYQPARHQHSQMHQTVKRCEPRSIHQFFQERFHGGGGAPLERTSSHLQRFELSNDEHLFGIFIGSILLGLTVSNELLAGSRGPFKSFSVKTNNVKLPQFLAFKLPLLCFAGLH